MRQSFNTNISDYFKRGFTLVELIVVIAVSTLLLAGGIALLNPAKQFSKGNDAKRKADLARVQTAFELYRSDNGNYPISTIGLSGLTDGTPKYLPSLPADPKTGQSGSSYIFYTATPSAPACDNASSVCTGYQLYVCLENLSDPTLDTPTDQSSADKCPATGFISYTVTDQ